MFKVFLISVPGSILQVDIIARFSVSLDHVMRNFLGSDVYSDMMGKT